MAKPGTKPKPTKLKLKEVKPSNILSKPIWASTNG
jgi:hypothetical protein